MQLFRLREADQKEFDTITEVAMDLNFARSRSEEFYLDVGGSQSRERGSNAEHPFRFYGLSGGGVEVKFTSLTNNRCPIADPVVLPAL